MSLRFALTLLLCSPTLVFAAVRFGPERQLVSPRPVSAEGSQLNTSIASSGTESLVAWVDTTRGREGVYLAALAADGSLLDGSQRRLATGASAVTLTWTGESYLALWSPPEGGIYATTLDRDRRTILAPRLVLPGGQIASTVEWAGNRAIFVYFDQGYRAALIGRDGNVVRSGILFPGNDIATARVFSDGQSYLAIWEVRSFPGNGQIVAEVFAARYTAEGEPLDAAPVRIATLGAFSGTWEAAFDGTRYALAIAESGPTTRLRRFIIDPATLQSTALPSVDIGGVNGVRLEWNGSRFLAYWLRNETQTYALQTFSFSADGTGDAAPVTISTRQGNALQPSGVWNGQALMVAWAGSGLDSLVHTDVYATAVAANAELSISHFPISLAPPWQGWTTVTTDGNRSLILWLEGLNDESARLAAAPAVGGKLSGPTTYLSDAAQGRAQVVNTGAMYLVFYLESTGNIPRLVMRRLGLDGAVLDAEETYFAYTTGFAVAFNGTHALLAYNVPDGAEAVRLTVNGTPLDDTPLLIPNAGAVRAASNGTDFVLVWQEGTDELQFPDGRAIDVLAAVIGANGVTLNPRIEIAAGPANQRQPVIASNGLDYVIAYAEDERLVARKLLSSGVAAEATVVDTAQDPAEGWFPFIAATDGGYIAGWEVLRHSFDSSVRLAQLDANGRVTDGPTTVATSGYAGMYPALATSGATGDLVYARLHDDTAYGAAMRIFVRRLGEEVRPKGRAVRH